MALKNLIWMAFIAATFLIAGCTPANTEKPTSPTGSVHAQNGHESSHKLILDNGNKWKANLETTQAIQQMITLVDNYLASNDEDEVALRKSLEVEFAGLVQKCTMTGAAHDQLHNYILPLKDRIKLLNGTAGERQVQELRDYLKKYRDFFE